MFDSLIFTDGQSYESMINENMKPFEAYEYECEDCKSKLPKAQFLKCCVYCEKCDRKVPYSEYQEHQEEHRYDYNEEYYDEEEE